MTAPEAPFTVLDIMSAVEQGREAERARILYALETAPIAFDFFGPYVPRDKVIAFIKGES